MRGKLQHIITVTYAGLLLFAGAVRARASDIPSFDALSQSQEYVPQYRWTVTPVLGGSELLTLVGRFDESASPESSSDVPLVAILRDRLPGGTDETTRLRYVWLLTERAPRLYQRALSAIPFFFWAGDWTDASAGHVPKPLTDLSDPSRHVFTSFTRNILQWTAFDPLTTEVRAASRAYGANTSENARLHVAEALLFLREAPAGPNSPLSQSELNTVIARLSLTQTLLGGFVEEPRLDGIAFKRTAARVETIGRNWELLRTSAERAGLVFQPLKLGDSSEEYGMLWFPLWRTFSSPGVSLESTWRLLHISNPWTDDRFRSWNGYRQIRSADAEGHLLPEGVQGANTVGLAPLAIYSLSYPGAPLLMIDFRHNLTTKRREILQRGSNELVMGVLGLSHFANWYYFAGQAAYQFVRARHGSAENLSARLDSYSEFRVAVILDRDLDPELKGLLKRSAEMMDVNPLGTSAARDIKLARANWDALHEAALDPKDLPEKIDRDRREELADFGHGAMYRAGRRALYFAPHHLWRRNSELSEEDVNALAHERQVASLLAYLERVRAAGLRPEVSFPSDQIASSVEHLSKLVNEHSPPSVRNRTLVVISAMERETGNLAVATNCRNALNALNTAPAESNSKPGLAALPRTISSSVKAPLTLQ